MPKAMPPGVLTLWEIVGFFYIFKPAFCGFMRIAQSASLCLTNYLQSPQKWWKWLDDCSRRVERLFDSRYATFRHMKLNVDSIIWNMYAASPGKRDA